MFTVKAQIDVRSIIETLNAGDRMAWAATASALSKAAAKARTQVVRDLAAEYRVKPQRIIRRRMKISPRATRQSPFSTGLRYFLRSIPVIVQAGVVDHGAEGSGVTTPQGTLYQAWIMQSKKGTKQRHVFQRKGSTRLPIRTEWIKPSRSLVQFHMFRRLEEQAPTVAAEIERQIILRINKVIGDEGTP